MIWKLLRQLVDRMTVNKTENPSEDEITLLLNRKTGEDATSHDRLAELLFPDLKRIAISRMRGERSDHTLQATALVNELYLHLLRQSGTQWTDRSHFLLAASQAMHRLLVDHARAKRARKRGGTWLRMPLDEVGDKYAGFDSLQVLEVDELLARLAKNEPRMASVVELKFFGGLTFSEIGDVLAVDERTAKRDWALARVWFRGQWSEGGSDVGGGMGENQNTV
jgi:RNA polymerase sigma factor (TIGR02999 family)